MEEVKTDAQPVNSKGSTGLEPNVLAALAYVLGAISGIIVFVVEKDNKFVKFHAVQAILTHLAVIVFSFVVNVVPVLGLVISGLMGLLSIVLALFLAYQAYSNKEFMVPVLGKIAKDFVNKQ